MYNFIFHDSWRAAQMIAYEFCKTHIEADIGVFRNSLPH